MKSLTVLFLSLVLVVGVKVDAKTDCPSLDRRLDHAVYQQITVSSTAIGLTLPGNFAVRMAVLVVEGGAIRYRDDGTDPTSAVGIPADPKMTIIVCGVQVGSFRAIRQSADAVLNAVIYGD